MIHRLAAALVAGSLTLVTIPALAQDGSDSSTSSTEASSVSSAVSTSSSMSSLSSKSRMPVRKMIGKIANKCEKLHGRSRADCVHGANFGQAVKAVRRNIKAACEEHEKGSAEYRTCMSEKKSDAKSTLKDLHPRAMNMRRHGKKMMNERSSESSSSSSSI